MNNEISELDYLEMSEAELKSRLAEVNDHIADIENRIQNTSIFDPSAEDLQGYLGRLMEQREEIENHLY